MTCEDSKGRFHGPLVAKGVGRTSSYLGNYDRGEKAGTWFYFYHDGSGSVLEHRDGQRVAEWTFYEIPDGPSEVIRLNNEYDAHGTWNTWYRNGQKRHERHYTDGRATGVWRQWNEDGDLLDETNFDDASPDEIVGYNWLRPDGSVRIEGAYRDGLPAGTWSWWDESGEVLLQECEVEGWELGECWMEKKEYPLPM